VLSKIGNIVRKFLHDQSVGFGSVRPQKFRVRPDPTTLFVTGQKNNLQGPDLSLEGGHLGLDEEELLPEVGIAEGELLPAEETLVQLNDLLLQHLLPPDKSKHTFVSLRIFRFAARRIFKEAEF
jgi:hypothetical protein